MERATRRVDGQLQPDVHGVREDEAPGPHLTKALPIYPGRAVLATLAPLGLLRTAPPG